MNDINKYRIKGLLGLFMFLNINCRFVNWEVYEKENFNYIFFIK